jgi:SAM-dependent methyltransferase
VHRAIRGFVEDVAEAIELPDPIVEFGAMQVEAEQDADLRALFPGRPYLGTDAREGPGVDRVEDLLALGFGDGEVGTAICLETLEHVTDPPAACRELARVVADGGVAIVSAPTLLGIHAYPDDYFRFMPSSFRAMLAGFDDVWVHGLGDPSLPMWVVGVAAKGRRLDLSLDRLPRTAHVQREFDESRGRFRLGPARWSSRDLARTVLPQLPRVVRQRIADRVRRRR